VRHNRQNSVSENLAVEVVLSKFAGLVNPANFDKTTSTDTAV